MKVKTKRAIALTISWLTFMLLLGIVGGCERGWTELRAMWWCVPCLLVWAGGLWKAGWIRVWRPTHDNYCFMVEDIGKTVFLAREEAEAALKRGQDDD